MYDNSCGCGCIWWPFHFITSDAASFSLSFTENAIISNNDELIINCSKEVKEQYFDIAKVKKYVEILISHFLMKVWLPSFNMILSQNMCEKIPLD